MTSEKRVYEEIRTKNLDAFNNGNLQIEKDFDLLPDDGCRGFVLQISYQDGLWNYEEFLKEYLESEPHQYYSPRLDLHTTVFEFVPVRKDFKSFQDFVPAYKNICKEVLGSYGKFPIEFRGCVFTPGSGIICGYDDDVLVEMRSKIRSAMTRDGLELQERYHSQTAHVSFMGFKDSLKDFARFRNLVDSTRSTFIDRVVIDRMELVSHDWFNRYATKEILQEYQLM